MCVYMCACTRARARMRVYVHPSSKCAYCVCRSRLCMHPTQCKQCLLVGVRKVWRVACRRIVLTPSRTYIPTMHIILLTYTGAVSLSRAPSPTPVHSPYSVHQIRTYHRSMVHSPPPHRPYQPCVGRPSPSTHRGRVAKCLHSRAERYVMEMTQPLGAHAENGQPTCRKQHQRRLN